MYLYLYLTVYLTPSLDTTGVAMTVTLKDVDRFEAHNAVSVNVFGYEGLGYSECFTEPIDTCKPGTTSYTHPYQRHAPSGYAFHIVSDHPRLHRQAGGVPRTRRGRPLPLCATVRAQTHQHDGRPSRAAGDVRSGQARLRLSHHLLQLREGGHADGSRPRPPHRSVSGCSAQQVYLWFVVTPTLLINDHGCP